MNQSNSNTVSIIDNTIYYDMQIFNNSSSSVNLSFTEQRQYPIFNESTDNYKMSVIRFSADSDLPTLIPQVQTLPNTNPNLLIYSFTMVYKTYEFRQYVEFVPQVLSVSPPSIINNTSVESPYYWLYDGGSFINMLNTALVNCWNGLSALVVAGGDSMLHTSPSIYYEMNPVTYIIHLCADATQYDNALTNPISLYVNTPLHSMLKAFAGYSYYGFNNQNGKDVKFNITNYNNLNVYTNSGINYLMIYSEYSSIQSWSPVNSIVITTNLPVVSTLISAPNIIDDQFYSNFPIANNEKQISDFIYNVDTNINSSGAISYTSQIYRYVNLEKSAPITQLQISFYWKSKRGNYFNFELDNSGCASIKLMFERIR